VPEVLGVLVDGEPVASGVSAKRPDIFQDQRDPTSRSKARGYAPGESPDDLKKLIGELTVQNDILKKSRGLLGN